MNSYRAAVLSFLSVSALALGVSAPAAAHMADCGPGDARGEMMKYRAEHREQYHQKLHEALKLKPEQESAWNKLMASEKPLGPSQLPSREEMQKLSTPEREERMLERMKERQARMSDHLAALKEFYGALSPEQKKVFDDFHAGPRGTRQGTGPRAPRPEAPAKP